MMTLLFDSLHMPAILLFAVLLDHLLGEPRRGHPLAGFGWLALQVERSIYRANQFSGLLAVLMVVLPWVFMAYLLQRTGAVGMPFAVVVLYFAIAPRSLREHAMRVSDASDLHAARKAVGMMVSRDTTRMDEEGVARATVESVLENGNDAIFGALFWFVVAGLPGVVLYRLSNTLDAMWGYRNERYNEFGRAAARLDDVLNYIPARLTALSYTLLGNARCAWRCWRQQAAPWESPNAGPVMAAGAGALQLRLGGAAIYHGKIEQRPVLGCGEPPSYADIARAVRLIQHTLYLWLIVISLGMLLMAGMKHGA